MNDPVQNFGSGPGFGGFGSDSFERGLMMLPLLMIMQSMIQSLVRSMMGGGFGSRGMGGMGGMNDGQAYGSQSYGRDLGAMPAGRSRRMDPTTWGRSRGHDHGPDGALEPVRTTGANGRLHDSELKSVGDGHRLAGPAADSFNRMQEAAARDGITLGVNSSYRDVHDQQRMVRQFGLYKYGGRAAEPGHSNHGLGKSVDLDVKQKPEVSDWLHSNARRFGFVNDVQREPWHWTYQG